MLIMDVEVMAELFLAFVICAAAILLEWLYVDASPDEIERSYDGRCDQRGNYSRQKGVDQQEP